MRERRRIWPWAIAFGLLLGAGAAWLARRPAPPFQLDVIGRKPPQSEYLRPYDGHLVRVWLLPSSIDTVQVEVEKQLTPVDGWQPANVRRLKPKVIQYARVRSSNGDFEFLRILLEAKGADTQITVDEGPRQNGAFR